MNRRRRFKAKRRRRARKPLRSVCAWCPGFDPMAASNAGASHGMCPNCVKKFEASWRPALQCGQPDLMIA